MFICVRFIYIICGKIKTNNSIIIKKKLRTGPNSEKIIHYIPNTVFFFYCIMRRNNKKNELILKRLRINYIFKCLTLIDTFVGIITLPNKSKTTIDRFMCK